MAEYFRDEKHQDVLLFIDNIFRFTQAGSEVSALIGRMPSGGSFIWPNTSAVLLKTPLASISLYRSLPSRDL